MDESVNIAVANLLTKRTDRVIKAMNLLLTDAQRNGQSEVWWYEPSGAYRIICRPLAENQINEPYAEEPSDVR